MNIFKLVYWVLYPQKAVEHAQYLLNRISVANLKSIAYINEFFFKYATWGKPKEYGLKLSYQIENETYSSDKIVNALIDLRKIRLKAKALIDLEDLSQEPQVKMGVSTGVVRGKIININSTNKKITPNSIGVFPSSGTKYTNLYKRCVGLIFLKGGITSHGAIIAREFNIPALIYPKLKIRDGTTVEINGETGSLTVVD